MRCFLFMADSQLLCIDSLCGQALPLRNTCAFLYMYLCIVSSMPAPGGRLHAVEHGIAGCSKMKKAVPRLSWRNEHGACMRVVFEQKKDTLA